MEVSQVSFSPGGQRLAVAFAGDATLQVVSVAPTPATQRYPHHTPDVRALAFSPNGEMLASGATDNKVRVSRVNDQDHRVWTLEGHKGWVQALAFSPDSKLLASGSADGTVRLWAMDGQKAGEQTPLDGCPGEVRSLAFSPDGALLASGLADGRVCLWNVPERRSLPILAPNGGTPLQSSVMALTFAPDGKVLAAGFENGALASGQKGDGRRSLWRGERVV